MTTETATHVVKIGEAIEGIYVNTVGALAGEPFYIEFGISKGEQASFEVTFNGIIQPTGYNEQARQGITTSVSILEQPYLLNHYMK